LLRRVGSCSGANVFKAEHLGIEMCTAGWATCGSVSEDSPTAHHASDSTRQSSCSSPAHEDKHAARSATSASGASPTDPPCSWPAQGDVSLQRPPKLDEAAAAAPAVVAAAAHVVALVTHVRSVHEHFVLTCETVRAYVRREYWSGKTLCAQHAGVAPILTFLGSQHFGQVHQCQKDQQRTLEP